MTARNPFRDLPDEPEQSGFRPVKRIPRCVDPRHQPPTMLYVPPDQEYVHVCPSCGQTTILRGSDATLSDLIMEPIDWPPREWLRTELDRAAQLEAEAAAYRGAVQEALKRATS